MTLTSDELFRSKQFWEARAKRSSKMAGKALALPLFFVVLMCMTPQTARGQICGGSSIRYVVRDVRGNVIDPANAIGPDAKTRELAESNLIPAFAPAKEVIKFPEGGKIKLVYISSMPTCNFKEPVKLTLTLNGKEMKLIFNVASRWDLYFLVDSMPFQPGTFEINLEENRFYPRKEWKKIG